MHSVVAHLLANELVSEDEWVSFWTAVREKTIDRAEAAALLALLARESLSSPLNAEALLRSLDRWSTPSPQNEEGVNVVGTGGGPPTFNISTAAAVVAAAGGVRVIKSGSRAYQSSCGSVDLLQAIGVEMSNSSDESERSLEKFGVAFVGSYVYPKEFVQLARLVAPLPLKGFGRFFNAFGPFLADVPVRVQITGISDRTLLAGAKAVADLYPRRSVWLVHNPLGVDELVGCSANTLVRPGTAGESVVKPTELGVQDRRGCLDDLRPVGRQDLVDHFERVVAGRVNAESVSTVALNAGCMAYASEMCSTLDDCVAHMRDVVVSGKATALLKNLRRR